MTRRSGFNPRNAHDATTRRGTRSAARRGFTLVELIISTAIMSLLFVGLASAIVLAGKAMPDRTSLGQTLATTAQVADQIAAELRTALWIREHTATSVAFTVPDRTGDGLPERIRYAWSGTADTPLTRQYNGGNVVNVVEKVHYFNLDYMLDSQSETIPGAPVESAETILQSNTTRYYARDWTVKNKEWCGQHINPSLSESVVSWRITRVQFRAKYSGSQNGILAIQIRPVVDGGSSPETTVLEEVGLNESALGSGYDWKEITFNTLRTLTPGKKYCLVIACQKNDTELGYVEYDYWSGNWLVTTTNGGSSWSYSSSNGMYHYIYGTYSTPGSPLTVTRHYCRGARVTLQPTSEQASRVATATQTSNVPEFLAACWETGFDTNPTLDHNGDGVDDWTVDGGGTFDLSDLQDRTGGKLPVDLSSLLDKKIWLVDAAITTNPDHAFQTLTTIESRFRATIVGGDGAAIGAKIDRGGGLCGYVTARLTLQSDSTQTLELSFKTDDATNVVIKTIPGLTNDFVELRLVIDPNTDTCNVKADGVDYGSFKYVRYAPASTTGYVTILNSSSSVQFDSISVRVSE